MPTFLIHVTNTADGGPNELHMHFSLQTASRAEAIQSARLAYAEAAKTAGYIPKGKVAASHIQSVQIT